MDTPSGLVSYSWDPAGRREALSDHLGTTTYTWTPGGRQEQISRPNGIDTTYDYDLAGRLVGIDHIGADGPVATFGYTLDAAGNRIGVDTADGTETYVLDELNRLVSATYADGSSESFGYDPAGNRTTHTDPNGTTTFGYDLAGQLVSSSGPDGDLTYTHDPVGRLTSISDGTAYGYDPAGRLIEATVDGVTRTYGYDADGVRVDVDGQAQLWDRSGPLPTLVDDGQAHTWGPDANLQTTGDQFALVDALGSVRAHTDTTGELTTSVDYHAFGTPTTAGWDSFGYTSGHHDPTGLIHLRARQHHPGLGRFTTRDPIQPGAPGTGGYNHYTYVANNPTTWTDPTGMLVDNALIHQGVSTRTKVVAGAVAVGVIGIVGQLLACLGGFQDSFCFGMNPYPNTDPGGAGAGAGGGGVPPSRACDIPPEISGGSRTFYRGTTAYDAMEVEQTQAIDLSRIAQNQALSNSTAASGVVYLTKDLSTAINYARLAGGFGVGGGPGVLRIEVPAQQFEEFARTNGIEIECAVENPPTPDETATRIPFDSMQQFDSMATYTFVEVP